VDTFNVDEIISVIHKVAELELTHCFKSIWKEIVFRRHNHVSQSKSSL